MTRRRNRIHYAIVLGLVIVAGCASRSPLSNGWPPLLVTYAGDTLWSLMLFLGTGLVWPKLSTAKVGIVVLFFSYGIEFSQLYDAAWIQACRETLLGAIFLGSGFVGSDFICYTVGVGLGVLAELNPFTQECSEK